MTELDTGALQQEFEGMTAGETEAEPTQEQVEMIELALGDQVHKIPINAEFPVKHNGQVHKAPLDKLFTAWRERSHYDDKFRGLKEERSKFDQERGDFEAFTAMKQKFGDIQNWSEKNPDQWNALWDMFQNRDQHLAQGDESQSYLAKEIAAMREELGGLREFKSSHEQEMERRQQAEDVASVEKEIAAFTEEFPDIDLGEKDPDGITLKANIVSFGIDHNMPDFESAALKYLKPRLVQTAEMKGRKETVAQVKKDHAAGVMGRSQTPFSGKGDVDPRKMSRDDVKDAATAEFERLLSQQQ